MTAAAVGALLVLACATVARLLLSWNLSAPLAFAIAGGILGFAGLARTGEELVRVRALLNMESGLNQGLAAPVALLALAVLLEPGSPGPGLAALHALGERALCAGVGIATGVAGAWVIGLRRPTVLFLGWSGPRGLATVVRSMVSHGFTADPLARRCGRWADRVQPPVETGDAAAPRSRGWLVRRAQP